MRRPPADVMASWPAPNYVDPITRRPYLVPVNVILISVATIMVILRMYARFYKTRTGGVADYLIMLALIPAIGLSVTLCLAGTKYGWNKHIYDIEPTYSNLVNIRLISWISEMLYLWTSSLTKLSFLVFYRTLFQTPKMQAICLGFIYLTSVYLAACFLTILLECRPISLYWHLLVVPVGTGGTCLEEADVLIPYGVVNVVIDVVIFILPIRAVLALRMGWEQKIQMMGIFLAGAVVVACSIIRIYATWVTLVKYYDTTWYGYLVWMWVGIEVDVGIICASIPACKSLVRSWKLSKVSKNTRRSTTFRQRMDLSTLGTVTTIAGAYFRDQPSHARDGSQDIILGQLDSGSLDYPANWVGRAMFMSNSKNGTRASDWESRTQSQNGSASWMDDDEADLEYLGNGNIMGKEDLQSKVGTGEHGIQ